VIGATSPCQLSTNLSALAYASAQPVRGRPFLLGIAYVAGKVSVYTIVGGLVILAGLRLEAVSIPVVQVTRKALGPLMLVIGLGMLGLIPLKTTVGQRLAVRLRERFARQGLAGAYLLGVAFSFAFCPTLFWLFFGLTLPLALRSSGGWMFPGLFAVGSSLPLLVVLGIVAASFDALEVVTGRVRRIDRPLRAAAGAILIVAGVHDTLVYWWL
jgi:cytochrome c biogenesis protein CcdA